LKKPVKENQASIKESIMKRDIDERISAILVGSKMIGGLAGFCQKIMISLFLTSPLRPIKTFFNGTWLEHPLHPLLTDVPIGAWTAAIVFDLLALLFHASGLGVASAIVTGLGILAALAAIVTGFMDWMDVDPPELAVGITHASINITATVLFIISFALAWANNWDIRWRVFLPALAGYGIVACGAYLGGSLVFRRGVMINRNAYRSGPKNFIPVLPLKDLAENQLTRADAKGRPILLLRRGDQIFAIGAVCSHYGGPLEKGALKDDTVICSWHFSKFSLTDGRVVGGPATAPLPAYETRINNGSIEIRES
jgi:nitrite reductase/ring-hydroxylating ferredoxin subunit/uncharacterized membrane protein